MPIGYKSCNLIIYSSLGFALDRDVAPFLGGFLGEVRLLVFDSFNDFIDVRLTAGVDEVRLAVFFDVFTGVSGLSLGGVCVMIMSSAIIGNGCVIAPANSSLLIVRIGCD